MKKWLSLILATVMLTAVCATALVANAAERTPVAQVTNAQKNAYVKTEDGFVSYNQNETDAVKTITSGGDDGQVWLRWVNILIFDGNGKLVELGNNLLTTKEAADKGGTWKTTVNIPAHGTMVVYTYAADKPTNKPLQDVYDANIGTAISNSTKEVESNYYLEIDNATTLSIYDGPAPVESKPTESSQPTETSKPTESSDASSEAPSGATSSTSTPSQGEPSTGDVGLIVFALLGVLAIAGAAVVIRVKR